MPASFTRTCTGPSAACTRSTAAATLAPLATSASTATARRWSAATSSATCRPPAWSRSTTATSAPSRARRRQIARPMPEAPPVTIAFRPLSPMREPLVGRAPRRQTVLRGPMHLDYTPEQQALREELRAYFARLVTPEYQAELAGTEGGGPLYLKTVERPATLGPGQLGLVLGRNQAREVRAQLLAQRLLLGGVVEVHAPLLARFDAARRGRLKARAWGSADGTRW